MAVERDLIEGRPSRPDAPLARYPHVLANGFDFTEERMRRDKLVDSLTRQIPADARLGEDSREKLRAAFKLLASHPDLTPAGRVAAIAEVARKANHRAVYEIALKSLFNLYDFVPQSTYAADHGVTDRGLKFSYAPMYTTAVKQEVEKLFRVLAKSDSTFASEQGMRRFELLSRELASRGMLGKAIGSFESGVPPRTETLARMLLSFKNPDLAKQLETELKDSLSVAASTAKSDPIFGEIEKEENAERIFGSFMRFIQSPDFAPERKNRMIRALNDSGLLEGKYSKNTLDSLHEQAKTAFMETKNLYRKVPEYARLLDKLMSLYNGKPKGI